MADRKNYLVTMTDPFMSGWGQAEGKICKYIYECDTLEDAQIVASNAERRGDQKRVTIYFPSDVCSHYRVKPKMKNWYEVGNAIVKKLDKSSGSKFYEKGYFQRK